jgi:hypothetical protein
MQVPKVETRQGREIDRYLDAKPKLSIDEWLINPSRESFLLLAYLIREAKKK